MARVQADGPTDLEPGPTRHVHVQDGHVRGRRAHDGQGRVARSGLDDLVADQDAAE